MLKQKTPLSDIASRTLISTAESAPLLFGLNGQYHAANFKPREFAAYKTHSGIIHTESSFLIFGDSLFFEDLSHRNYDPLWWFREHDPRQWNVSDEPTVVAAATSEHWPTLPPGLFLPPMESFGHFMFEMLPRLAAADHIKVSTVITTTRLPTRFLEIIRFFFPNLNVLVIPNSPFFNVCPDTWIVTAPMGRGFDRGIEANFFPFRELRRIASLKMLREVNFSAPKKIYVSRGAQAGNRRRVENESDVLTFLSSKGFEALDPSEMSWTDQLYAFMNADQVFGVFGSQMLTCQFMRTHSSLGIAFPEGLTLNYQSYLPLAFGVNVSRVIAYRSTSRDINPHLNSDIYINLDDLRGFTDVQYPEIPRFQL